MAKTALNEADAPLVSRHQIAQLETTSFGMKRIRARGPFQRLDVANANDRLYRRGIFEQHLKDGAEFKNRLKNKMVLGEVEHPESGITDLNRVSHLILDVTIESLEKNNPFKVDPGLYVMGEYLTLDTQGGRLIRELHEVGIPVGVSSRGRGNTQLTANGIKEVMEDYELDTWDVVYNPSVKEAYTKPVALKEDELRGRMEVKPGEETPPALDVAPTAPVPGELPKPELVAGEPLGKSEASILVRAMEDAAATGDLADLSELLSRASTVMKEVANDVSPDAATLKGQILSLQSVLASRMEFLKGAEKEKPKAKKKEKEEESLTEGTMDDLAGSFEKNRGKEKGDVDKAELEGVLNQAGHEPEEAKIRELAAALRSKGYRVKEEDYGKLGENGERRIGMAGETAAMTGKKSEEAVAHFARKFAEAERKLQEMKDSVPKARYDALREHDRVTLHRLQRLQRDYALLERKYKKAAGWFEKLLNCHKRRNMQTVVERLVSRVPDLASVRGLLTECKTKEELAGKAKQLVCALRSTQRRVEGGPSRSGLKPLFEGQTFRRVREAPSATEGAKPREKNVAEVLLEGLSAGVSSPKSR